MRAASDVGKGCADCGHDEANSTHEAMNGHEFVPQWDDSEPHPLDQHPAAEQTVFTAEVSNEIRLELRLIRELLEAMDRRITAEEARRA